MSSIDRWLPQLEPPQGGLERLRSRIDVSESQGVAIPWFAMAISIGVILALWPIPVGHGPTDVDPYPNLESSEQFIKIDQDKDTVVFYRLKH